MKKFFTIGIILSFIMLASVSFAGIFGGDDQDTEVNTDVNVENTDTNVNVNKPTFKTNIVNWDYNSNVNKAYGGNAEVDINNKDVNINKVDNTDVNINKVDQDQGQIQGQGQKQQQGQKQSMDQGQEQSQANKQKMNLTIIHPEPKRDHLQGPDQVQPDAKLYGGVPFQAKTRGLDRFLKLSKLTEENIDMLAYDCDDYDIQEELIFEGDYRTKAIINLGDGEDRGAFMGNITLTPDGDDVSVGSCFGRVLQKAIRHGATHFRVIYVGEGEASQGSAAGISLNGGASIMTDGDRTAIAPNGGIGYSKAEAWSELRPDITIELFYDSSVLGATVIELTP